MPLTPLFPAVTSAIAAQPVSGNGIVVNVNGQLIGREMVAVPGIGIAHPSGIDGAPRFTAQPSLVAATTTLDLNTTDEQPIHLSGYQIGRIERFLFWGASADIASAVGSITTAQGQTGITLLSGQAFSALGTGYGSHIEAEATNAIVGEIPVLFFKLATTEASAATVRCSVLVQGLTGQEY